MTFKNKRSIQILSVVVLFFFLSIQPSHALAPSRNISLHPHLTQHAFSEATFFFWLFPEPVFITIFLSLYLVAYLAEGEKIKKEEKLKKIQSEFNEALAKVRSEKEKKVCQSIAKQFEIIIKGEIQHYQAFLALSHKLLGILFFFTLLSIPSVSYFLWKNAKEVFFFLSFFFIGTFLDSKLKPKKPIPIPTTPTQPHPLPVIDLGEGGTEISI